MDTLTDNAPVIETPAVEAPVVDKPIEQAAPAPEVKSDPKDRRNTIREALIASGAIVPKDAQRNRDDKGKFAPVQQQATQQGAAIPAVIERPKMPKSLPKELEPLWAQAPDELAKAFLKRDQDAEKGVREWSAKYKQAEPILNEFKPYEQLMANVGTNPVAVIRNLLPTMAILRTGSPGEKARAVAQAMADNGIPFEHLAQVMQGQTPQAQGSPQVAHLLQEINQLKQNFQGVQQSAAQADTARLTTIADNWGKAKPYYQVLTPHMAHIMQSGEMQETDDMGNPKSEDQLLDEAYNLAIERFPALSQAAQQQAQRQRDTQMAQQARGAALQVKGAPGAPISANQIDPNDRRGLIAAQIRNMGR